MPKGKALRRSWKLTRGAGYIVSLKRLPSAKWNKLVVLGRQDRPLHCTALHCTALHCTALHCTATPPMDALRLQPTFVPWCNPLLSVLSPQEAALSDLHTDNGCCHSQILSLTAVAVYRYCHSQLLFLVAFVTHSQILSLTDIVTHSCCHSQLLTCRIYLAPYGGIQLNVAAPLDADIRSV